ncbi:MAG: DUF1810 domain-containing protein [Amaricoccus sp.]|uniref:DUF1810 domain-containing protein n=1 Tax=Amaricoccus sp. TaxID=1872485 RepID=UPI0039E4782D
MTRFDIFVSAQDAVWPAVTAELAAGRKRSHWMWFVFPQIAGLGGSETAVRFAIGSLAEARSYLAHPVLAPRLRQATGLILCHAGREASLILGHVDALKLRSSMTLFQAADPAEPLFGAALAAFSDGVPDPRTLALLKGADLR